MLNSILNDKTPSTPNNLSIYECWRHQVVVGKSSTSESCEIGIAFMYSTKPTLTGLSTCEEISIILSNHSNNMDIHWGPSCATWEYLHYIPHTGHEEPNSLLPLLLTPYHSHLHYVEVDTKNKDKILLGIYGFCHQYCHYSLSACLSLAIPVDHLLITGRGKEKALAISLWPYYSSLYFSGWFCFRLRKLGGSQAIHSVLGGICLLLYWAIGDG